MLPHLIFRSASTWLTDQNIKQKKRKYQRHRPLTQGTDGTTVVDLPSPLPVPLPLRPSRLTCHQASTKPSSSANEKLAVISIGATLKITEPGTNGVVMIGVALGFNGACAFAGKAVTAAGVALVEADPPVVEADPDVIGAAVMKLMFISSTALSPEISLSVPFWAETFT